MDYAKGGKVTNGRIYIKPSEEGSFHRLTGTPQGQKIPEAKIKTAENSPDPAVRKKAQFADNARKWNH